MEKPGNISKNDVGTSGKKRWKTSGKYEAMRKTGKSMEQIGKIYGTSMGT